MKEAITTLFENLHRDIEKNLEAAKNQKLADSSKPIDLKSSGTINVPFHLDGNGNFHFEKEQYGAGVTVHAKFHVDNPDAVYTITIKSSDGGGGHWENVQLGQELSCVIKTSLWHNTKITVDIHANAANVDGKATLSYSY